MNNVKKVPAIEYDKELANKSRVKARNIKPNQDAKLYLELIRKGKIDNVNVFNEGTRPLTYKEWLGFKAYSSQ